MDFRARRYSKGFTLIEMLIGVVLMAILAAIALPSYQSYITKSRARTASADLVALATDLENEFQRQLQYVARNTTTTAQTTASTIGWQPAEEDNFTFTAVATTNSYTLTATGIGSMAGCNLTLTNANVRTVTSTCGFTSW